MSREPRTEAGRALLAAYEAMDAACQWAAGETAGIKTIEDADRHMAGYDALLDATVKAGQAAGVLSGGTPIEDEAASPVPAPTLDVERLRAAIEDVLDTLERVVTDAESQHPGGWGPDVTTVADLRDCQVILRAALAASSVPAPTLDVERLREAARAYLDAEAEPAYSWVIESQAARHESRPNREVERMDRVARARVRLKEALATPDTETP